MVQVRPVLLTLPRLPVRFQWDTGGEFYVLLPGIHLVIVGAGSDTYGGRWRQTDTCMVLPIHDGWRLSSA